MLDDNINNDIDYYVDVDIPNVGSITLGSSYHSMRAVTEYIFVVSYVAVFVVVIVVSSSLHNPCHRVVLHHGVS